MDVFIHVYFDEDVDVIVANLLRSCGFEVTTVQQVGQLGKTLVLTLISLWWMPS